MPRKPRISYPGALHHVIAGGNRKGKIYLDNNDRKKFLSLIEKYQELHSFPIYAYVLMDNHFHILIEEREVPLSRTMQGISQSYTQYFNKRHKKVGHLFQGRYKSLLCDKDRYLLILVQYIHLNPIRKGIVSKPEAYQWSSHNAYYLNSNETFVNIEFVLSLFHKKRDIALANYSQF